MGLIGNHEDVAAVAQHPRPLLEFLYRGEDDAARLQVLQLVLQVSTTAVSGLRLFALGIQFEAYALRYLTHKPAATCKLFIQLLVEVVAIGHHDHRQPWRRQHHLMHKEHHGERLAAALRVPEHAALAILSGIGLVCPCQRFVHGKVLVVGSHDLTSLTFLMVEADVVTQDIQQPLLGKYPLEECVVGDDFLRAVLPVLGLPFHVAVLR